MAAEAVSPEVIEAEAEAERRRRVAEILERARKRAIELKDVPREELFAQFRETLESIRAEAIANDTAIEGE